MPATQSHVFSLPTRPAPAAAPTSAGPNSASNVTTKTEIGELVYSIVGNVESAGAESTGAESAAAADKDQEGGTDLEALLWPTSASASASASASVSAAMLPAAAPRHHRRGLHSSLAAALRNLPVLASFEAFHEAIGMPRGDEESAGVGADPGLGRVMPELALGVVVSLDRFPFYA